MMKIFKFFPIFSIFLLPINALALKSTSVNDACNSFATGEIDAYKTLETLGLDIDDYSIGISNTAKIFCA